MKSKYLASLLAAAMLCGAVTGCGGDSDEESGSKSKKSSRTTSSTTETDEDETDEDETDEKSTEDGTEATTRKIEKATGSQRETASSTSEAVTEEQETTAEAEKTTAEFQEPTTEKPKKPAQKYTGKLTDLTGKYTCEIMDILGDDMQLEADGMPGYYRIFNYDVVPGTDFYFNDHTCDNIYDGEEGLGRRKPEIIEKLRKEFSKIEKITCDSGRIDEFTPGMTYSDCMKIIRCFSASRQQ